VRHHLDVLDRLGVDTFILAGHSMGGWMASTLCFYAGNRVEKLILCSPAGLRDKAHPTTDLFSIPDEEFLGWLTTDMSIFEGHFEVPPTPAFLAGVYRENTSTARIMWDRNYDPKMSKWLHRLTMPTLILWGENDRIVPIEQAAVWKGLIPDSTLKTFANTGHLLIDEKTEVVEAIRTFAKD
jgi:pimeloyl-ACP methyl ester carboxylesterase